MNETDILDYLNIDKEDIKQDIIDAVANRIADEIGRDIKTQLKAKSSAAVENLITEIVCDLAEKTFTPVDHWGEPKGEPTTIKDMMVKSIENWWSAKVDSSGNVSTSYSAKLTRSEYFANKVVSEYVNSKLHLEMKAIIEAGKDKVREAMAKSVTEQIKKIW